MSCSKASSFLWLLALKAQQPVLRVKGGALLQLPYCVSSSISRTFGRMFRALPQDCILELLFSASFLYL